MNSLHRVKPDIQPKHEHAIDSPISKSTANVISILISLTDCFNKGSVLLGLTKRLFGPTSSYNIASYSSFRFKLV